MQANGVQVLTLPDVGHFLMMEDPEQFNALLRGGSREPFMEIAGDLALLPTIRYVLTLDTDTSLPRDAARQMVGTLAHRLNQPVFDAQSGRVVDGYTMLVMAHMDQYMQQMEYAMAVSMITEITGWEMGERP